MHVVAFSLFSNLLIGNKDVPVEIHGLVKLGEDYIFSVHHAETNQSKWIRKNQTFNGFVVIDYDPINSVVSCLYDDQTIRLTLIESKLTPTTSVPNEEITATYNPAEIRHLVGEFQKKEFARLPDKEEPLYFLLKQAAKNRIYSYESSLLSRNQNKETSNSELVTRKKVSSANHEPRIGSQRTRNNVNSRIWAADHVEQFGLLEF